MSNIVDLSELLLLLGLSSSATEEERGIAQYALKTAESSIKDYLQYNPAQTTYVEFYPQSNVAAFPGGSILETGDTSAYERQIGSPCADELQLKNIPIRSITEVRIDYDGRFGSRPGSFPSSSIKAAGSDYWASWDGIDSSSNLICRDGILRSVGLWPEQAGSVKITYVAGYTKEELHGEDSVINAYPIIECIIEEAMRKVNKVFQTKKKRAGWLGPLASENLGSYSYSSDTASLAKLIGGTSLSGVTLEKLNPYVNWGWSLSGGL